jgi:hypothetical protein
MCRDGELLSALADGELNQEDSATAERQLTDSDECVQENAKLRRLKAVFSEDREKVAEAIAANPDRKRELWARISAYRDVHASRRSRRFRGHDTVSIPVSGAIAAGLVMAFLAGMAFVAFFGSDRRRELPDFLAGRDGRLELTIQLEDSGQLRELLESRNDIAEIRIELPDTQRFAPIGEPRLLRAADFQGSVSEEQNAR